MLHSYISNRLDNIHALKGKEISASDLELGDIITQDNIKDVAYSSSTVIKITETEVWLIRPYIKTSDSEFAGRGIIPYIGFEEYQIPKKPEYKVIFLYRRFSPVR